MRRRLNWQYYLVWPDILIGKIQQPGKYFGRRTNLTLTLIVVSPERHALQKTYHQTVPVRDTVEGEKKTHFNWRTISISLPILSQEFINSYHSFCDLWANNFTTFPLYTWCHLTEWSSSLFPDRMGYKRGSDGEIGYLHTSPERERHYRCKRIIPGARKNRREDEHSIWREWEQVMKEYEGKPSELMGAF